jgi:hypothetical protein
MRERSSPKADAITRSPAAGRKNLFIRHKNFLIKNDEAEVGLLFWKRSLLAAAGDGSWFGAFCWQSRAVGISFQ